MRRAMTPFPRCGVSLIEALVALAVMSFGMMALLGVQTTMRFNSDVARQVTEATRLASEEIEQVRLFDEVATVAGQANPSWDELDSRSLSSVTLPGDTSNTGYSLVRLVRTPAGTTHKVVEVTVSWTDRNNEARSVRLNTVVLAASPRLSGLLSVPTTTAAASRRSGRHAAIPVQSVDLGDDRSAYKPFDTGSVAWVFNNARGVISSVCSVAVAQAAITLADLGSCSTVNGRLISGTVRFHGAAGVTAANAENPAGPALPLSASTPLAFASISGNTPVNQSQSPQCVADSPPSLAAGATRSDVRYACLVYLSDDSGWGGKLDLWLASAYPNGDGLPGGASTSAYRACRYTLASTDFTVNRNHPRTYCRVTDNTCSQRVTSSLANQNFLVIGSGESCPTATPASDALVNPNTLPHQP